MRLTFFHWLALGALFLWGGVLGAMYWQAPAPSVAATRMAPIKETHYVTPRQLAAAGQVSSVASELFGEGPVVLIFIKKDCPCSVEFEEYFRRLETGYAKRARFVGVIDADEARARAYTQEANVIHPILADPDLKLIRRLQVENGGYVALLHSDGELDTLWPGVSSEMMQQLGRRLAELVNIDEQPLDLTGLPDVLTTGCPYLP
jgi:phage pi2 protein 07